MPWCPARRPRRNHQGAALAHEVQQQPCRAPIPRAWLRHRRHDTLLAETGGDFTISCHTTMPTARSGSDRGRRRRPWHRPRTTMATPARAPRRASSTTPRATGSPGSTANSPTTRAAGISSPSFCSRSTAVNIVSPGPAPATIRRSCSAPRRARWKRSAHPTSPSASTATGATRVARAPRCPGDLVVIGTDGIWDSHPRLPSATARSAPRATSPTMPRIRGRAVSRPRSRTGRLSRRWRAPTT